MIHDVAAIPLYQIIYETSDDFFDKACSNTAGQALHAICNLDILLENTHRVYVVHNEYYDCK